MNDRIRGDFVYFVQCNGEQRETVLYLPRISLMQYVANTREMLMVVEGYALHMPNTALTAYEHLKQLWAASLDGAQPPPFTVPPTISDASHVDREQP